MNPPARPKQRRLTDQTLALAGMFQALRLVHSLAKEGPGRK